MKTIIVMVIIFMLIILLSVPTYADDTVLIPSDVIPLSVESESGIKFEVEYSVTNSGNNFSDIYLLNCFSNEVSVGVGYNYTGNYISFLGCKFLFPENNCAMALTYRRAEEIPYLEFSYCKKHPKSSTQDELVELKFGFPFLFQFKYEWQRWQSDNFLLHYGINMTYILPSLYGGITYNLIDGIQVYFTILTPLYDFPNSNVYRVGMLFY